MNAFRARLSWVVVLAAANVACLPMGPPPAGRHLIADRTVSLAALVPPNGDGLLRILLMRPGATAASANLSVVSLDADNQLSAEVPLISDIDPVSSVNCPGGVAPCGFNDQGQVEVFRTTGGAAWLDPVTGALEDVDPYGQQQHPTGQRYYHYDTQTSVTLYDADGHATPIQLATPEPNVYFASLILSGDDFYYLDPEHNLIDIPPSDVPQQVATGVSFFSVWTTSHGPLLTLTQTTPDGTGTQSSIVDLSAGTQTVVPFDVSKATVSPDGRWVLDIGRRAEGRFTFFDRDSGAQQSFDVYQPADFEAWRPGTSEAWISVAGSDDRRTWSVWILRPDAPAVSVPDLAIWTLNTDGGWMGSSFTTDGAYWFSTTTSVDVATPTIQVGPADNPNGPQYDLNSPGTFINRVWYLPDGRFLTTNYAKDMSRSDASVLDPRTGQTRLAGERGVVAAVGQTRYMGMFHVAESRGDLIVGDFENESPTSLASEFTVRAFAEARGADLLAPGARIIYQFQARAASPYDGIWVTECP